MLDALNDVDPTDEYDYSDWKKAFEVAGEFDENAAAYNYRDNSTDIRQSDPTEPVSLDEFKRDDVVEIIGIQSGDDGDGGATWSGLIAGRLADGRWFSLRAGCDYTGWDCQSGGHANVASSRETLIRMGLDDTERKELGL